MVTKKVQSFILLLLCWLTLVSCKEDTIKTELYFGLSNANGPITEKEWNGFKAETLDKILPGYTLIDGNGYWKGKDSVTYSEKTIILVYLHDDSPEEKHKINLVIEKYKKHFRQESVLQTDQVLNYTFK